MVFTNRTQIHLLFVFVCLLHLDGRVHAQQIEPIEIGPALLEAAPGEAPAVEAVLVVPATAPARLVASEKLAWVWDEPLSDHDNPEQPRFFRLTFDLDSVPASSIVGNSVLQITACLLYTSPSPRDRQKSRMPSSA